MRNITVWDPFRDLVNLQERINRIFSETAKSVSRGGEEDLESSVWVPAVDIRETDEGYILKVDLPGMKKEDIQVDISDNTLTIKGERKIESEAKKEDYVRIERIYGAFSRSFALPPNVDASKIKAKYENGVLELVLPKKEEAKPKKINIDVS